MKKLTLEHRISRLLTLMLLSTLILVPIASYSQAGEFPSVTDEMLQNPADGDWLMWRRTLDSWGYSPLDQVSRENVDELQLVWTRNLATGTGEITPLAYNGILFVPQANDIIEAIDAKTGDFIWQYRRDIPEDLYEMVGGNARNNRNLAIYEDSIINTSDDNYIFALDALTGNLEWETEILDYQVNSATHSSGPIIADGLAISGRSCRPWGGPNACVIVAHNASTGEEAWRRRLIPAPGEPGDETWGDVPFESRHHVGSWMVPSYDPELKLIILGTSVTSPAPKFYLGGTDNKHLYHNSTLALEVATGEIRWYYQHMNDHWDLDHPFERLLVETRVAPDPDEVTWINPNLQIGETRKVITGIPGKTGIVYTLDRATGEFLWATPTVEQNVVIDIDGSTGEVTENPEVIFREAEQIVFVCPTWLGGKDWEAGAYSPITNVMYYPLRNTCANMLATGNFESDTARSLTEGGQGGLAIYSLAARHQLTPGTENLGTVRAVSAETGRTEWLYETRAGTMSLVATGGGLIFGGDANGRFRAFDHESGEVLWEINLGSSVSGYPISFSVDGKQYIAVNTGGGQPNLTPELRPSRGTNLYVFALPD
ncbi:MAG: PQQ-binding-like beta-propeller repeat protein [Gammaproteobacteria bacterium]|jgi:PQQ-dependent dehydrogenase (methanol/ethanol family)|nr:PQQ-binding-like beta-propeller repeat protein [Gammaproteobacteria bacterium]